MRAPSHITAIPGPRSIPVLGTFWIYKFFGPYSMSTIHQDRMDLFKKFGWIYKEEIGGTNIVSVHDVTDIAHVFQNQGKCPLRSVNEANVYRRKSKPDTYKSVGLVDSSGKEWYSLRRKVSPHVLKPAVAAAHITNISKISDDFILLLRGKRCPVSHILHDVNQHLFRFTFEVIIQITVGSRIGALENNISPEIEKLINATNDQFQALADLSFARPTWKYINTPLYKKFCRAEEKIHHMASQYTQKAWEEFHNNNKTIGKDTTTILQRFLTVEDFDKRDINTVLVDMIAAGISTTSIFLTMLLHRLGQEPRVVKCLQNELDEILVTSSDQITERMLLKMPYLKATVKEGYRLTSIIPGIFRMINKDIVLQGYNIPAHTPIICQTGVASVLEEYSPCATSFLPERWLKNHHSFQQLPEELKKKLRRQLRNPFLVLPFGFGGRNCVGKSLAENEILVILAKILKNFNISSSGRLELTNRLIIAPAHPVHISFKDR